METERKQVDGMEHIHASDLLAQIDICYKALSHDARVPLLRPFDELYIFLNNNIEVRHRSKSPFITYSMNEYLGVLREIDEAILYLHEMGKDNLKEILEEVRVELERIFNSES